MASRAGAVDDRNTAPAYRTPVDNDALLTSFLRHWNRLPRAVREDAAELIAESHMGEIEP